MREGEPQIMTYQVFVRYAIVCAMVTLDRVALKKSVCWDAPLRQRVPR